MRAQAALLLAPLVLVGCQADTAESPEPHVRAVHALVAEQARSTQLRSFPAVLEPQQITPLAFDVGGRLGPLSLRIGQEVAEGEALATVEAEDATYRLQQAEAALLEAQTAAANAREDADRQETLFARGVASVAARDRAVTEAQQAEARVTQALRNLDLLQASLGDTTLRAPFDGIVDAIDVQAFGSVQAGQPILTLYEETALQATILVSFEVVTALELGQPVWVVPTDGDATPLPATLTEIGRRAAAVSSFPMVITLDETRPHLRSGMAVEVRIDLPVSAALQGIELPLSAIALNRSVALDAVPRRAQVFVARPRGDGHAGLELVDVTLGAATGTSVHVIDGVSPGDLVVTAGVSFLNPGQVVRLPETLAQAGQ